MININSKKELKKIKQKKLITLGGGFPPLIIDDIESDKIIKNMSFSINEILNENDDIINIIINPIEKEEELLEISEI